MKKIPNPEAVRLCDEGVACRTNWSVQGNIPKAERTFQAAIKADPTFWKGHYGLGNVLEMVACNADPIDKAGKRAAGNAYYKAAQLAPKLVEPSLALASLLASSNFPLAKKFYDYALQLPEDSELMFPPHWLGSKHWEFAIRAAVAGKKDLSSEAFRRALAVSPEHRTYYVDIPIANAALDAARLFTVKRYYGKAKRDTQRITLPKLTPPGGCLVLLVALTSGFVGILLLLICLR